MARLVDAAIDAAPQMLDEGAKQAPIGATDGEVSVEADFGLPHQAGFLCYYHKHATRLRPRQGAWDCRLALPNAAPGEGGGERAAVLEL